MVLAGVMVLVVMLPGDTLYAKNCSCVAVPADETTYWGLHARVVYDEVRRVKSFRGVVSALNASAALPETLVEVFSDGKIIAMNNSPVERQRKEKQIRVAACKTGTDGEFCFDQLSKGTYELRFSKVGWVTISLIIDYDPRKTGRAGKKIEVEMPIH